LQFDDVKDFPSYMDRLEDFDSEDAAFLDALEDGLPLSDDDFPDLAEDGLHFSGEELGASTSRVTFADIDFPDLASSSGEESDPSQPEQKQSEMTDQAKGVMAGAGLAAMPGLLLKSLSGLNWFDSDGDLTAVVDMDDIQNASVRSLQAVTESSRNVVGGAYVPTRGSESTA
jgi:hypothetical protein